MAGHRRKYVFTPARRAALRKARKVSAMKRHARARNAPVIHRKSSSNRFKTFGKGALAVGGSVAGVYAAYHTEKLASRYLDRPHYVVRDAKSVGRFVGGAGRALRNRMNPPKIKRVNWSKRGYL